MRPKSILYCLQQHTHLNETGNTNRAHCCISLGDEFNIYNVDGDTGIFPIIAFCVVELYCGKHTVALPWQRIEFLYSLLIFSTIQKNNKNNALLRFRIVAVYIVEVLQDQLFT